MKTNLDSESPFSFEELFFSRTNLKGIIQSGNTVFQRVSEYSWDATLQKPHSLIRHSDMPRGVFQLFWDYLKSGEAVGAFVKNRSQSGRYYWVFALAQPVENGYLSIRLKPHGKLFLAAQEIYLKLNRLESQQKLTPEQSKDHLNDLVKEAGFETYTRFMTEALQECLDERQIKLHRPILEDVKNLKHLIENSQKILQNAKSISKSYLDSQFIPLNLQILSEKIGANAAPLAVVASMYDKMAREIQEQIKIFSIGGSRVMEKINEAQFYVCARQLQQEMIHFFENETEESPIDRQKELSLLKDLQKLGNQKVFESLKVIHKEISQFQMNCEQLNSLSTGLDIVRVTGRIEISGLSTETEELHGLISKLTHFKSFLSQKMKDIEFQGAEILRLTEEIKKNTDLAA